MQAQVKLAPQEVRTFFVSSRTYMGQPLFRKEAVARLLLRVILQNRDKQRMQVHEFAIMHDHFHLLITPAPDQSLEKCVQFIKGGFSFLMKKELGYKWDVWQKSFNEHRVKDAEDYWNHVNYIRENPVVAKYVSAASEYEFCSAGKRSELDACPEHLRG